MAARALGTAVNKATETVGMAGPSPVQIDHMVRGYFGWLGAFVVGAGDAALRPLTSQPGRASPDVWKVATGGMVSDLRDAPSKYVSAMYDQAMELEQAYGTWRALQKQGKTQEAQEFFSENKEDLSRYRSVESVKRKTSQLNERRRIIERSSMDPGRKREELRKISEQQDRLARQITQRK